MMEGHNTGDGREAEWHVSKWGKGKMDKWGNGKRVEESGSRESKKRNKERAGTHLFFSVSPFRPIFSRVASLPAELVTIIKQTVLAGERSYTVY